MEKKEKNWIFLVIVVTQKPGVAPFLVTQKHGAAPFLITQKCGVAPFLRSQIAELIDFCDEYIIERFSIHLKECLLINRSKSEIWVTRNGATPHFWVPRNGATPCFWVARNGATPHFWVTTITKIFQFLPFFSLFLKLCEKPIISFSSANDPLQHM